MLLSSHHGSSRWRRFGSDRRGNFATLTALAAPALMAASAFAIDQGSLFLERRELQAATDAAALAAAADPTTARLSAAELLRHNGFPAFSEAGGEAYVTQGSQPDGTLPRQLNITLGRYVADPAVAVAARFVEGATPTNAVRIDARVPGTRHFAGLIGTGDVPIAASAIAAVEPQASFSVGSRLARLDGGISNALLGPLVGGSLSLSVMDYEALVSGKVRLFSMLDALDTALNLRAATYREILDADVAVGDLAGAMARLDGVSARARAALSRIATPGGQPRPRVRLGAVLGLGRDAGLTLGQRSAVDPVVGIMDVISATGALALARGGNQIALDLGVAVPGLISTKLTLAVGEPAQRSPWLTVGAGGEMVRTAQTRLLVDVSVGGPGGLLGSVIRLPVYVELASAEAKLARVRCASGNPSSIEVGLDARPGVARLMIAEPTGEALADFSSAGGHRQAKIVTLPLIAVTAEADIQVANGSFRRASFSRSDIDNLTVRRVSTNNLATSLTATLLANTDIEIKPLGLTLGLPAGLTSTVAGILGAAAPAVDAVLFSVLELLGVSIGEADLRVHGASCGRPYLVQ